MELLNVLLIVMAVAGGVLGWLSGFLGQAGSIAGLVGGVAVCRCKGDEFAAWLGPIVSPEGAESALTVAGCNIVLFIIVYIVIVVAARLLRTLFRLAMMGIFDRVAGAVFGVVKWWFLAGVVLNLWAVIQPEGAVATSAGTLVASVRDATLWLLGAGIDTLT